MQYNLCFSANSLIYLFAVLSADSDYAVEVDLWVVSFEAEHLDLELDLLFIAIVRDADGGVDWAARLNKNVASCESKT